MTFPADPAASDLTELVYELLDAHGDTMRLAAGSLSERPEWQAHLAYLRDLQRVGREQLAARDTASPAEGSLL